MVKLYVTLLLPCLLLFSQCREGMEPILTTTLMTGEWYYKGDPISFTWDSGHRKSKDEVISCAIEQNGLVIYEEDFTGKELISFTIPYQSRSGILSINCFTQSKPDNRSTFKVYYLENSYDSLSLSYYPPVPMAGSIVEASCSAENLSYDTWCRWSLEDVLIGEGYIKEGGSRVSFFGPRKKGNYTLLVELFPEKPFSEQEHSPHSKSIEIFFSESAHRNGTLSSESWQSLFYCDGSYIDQGRSYVGKRGSRALGMIASNDLTPEIVGSDRGYGFTSNSFLKYDGNILQGRSSVLTLIQTRMVLYSTQERVTDDNTLQIFTSKDGRGDSSLSLFMKEENLLFSLKNNDEFLRSNLEFPLSLEGVPFWLSLVIEQEDEDLLIRWYLDAILMKEDRFESYVLPKSFAEGGSIVWGRENYPSFEGILLEWGFNGEAGEIRKFEEDMNYESR